MKDNNENMNTVKTWVLGLLALVFVVLIINVVFFVMPMLSNLSASFTPARTITVSAQGMTTATPDLAEITFSVVSQGQNPTTLEANDSAKSAAISDFLGSQDIASSDIATTNYDLEPNYQYDTQTQRNYITGYDPRPLERRPGLGRPRASRCKPDRWRYLHL
jgi:uncharacterized protein YggE